MRYAFAYVRSEKVENDEIVSRDEKHIMRYQQLFASMAVRQKISEGIASGIIWHTQGSGKTALAYYLVNMLTDYYAKENKVPKFYFIVDRLDLLKQAKGEFEARGLKVSTANSRAELMKQFKTSQSLESNSGQREITVVNIQRFEDDREKVILNDYNTHLQRIFIIDEAHRGYKPDGCFLANLFNADKNAVKLALTGTPLIGNERNSCAVFGNYIHTYYYDKSIQDGYTLKILREEIETSYKEKLNAVYDNLDILVSRKQLRKSDITEHDTYIKALLKYIITDFKNFRTMQNDNSLGAMIICETSKQAEMLNTYFQEVQLELNFENKTKTAFKQGLVLYDSGNSDEKNKIIDGFKKTHEIDVLIVYNMLTTGFDAPRLKRLYFGRKIKDHNLLQAITRVNRPYKNMRYGFLVDFADIKKNFEETNEAYLRELNRFNNPNEVGQENITDTFKEVLEKSDEIIAAMREINEKLFEYDTQNTENFCTQISDETDKEKLIELRHVLENAKNMGNLVRTFGTAELQEKFAKIDLPKIPEMLSEVNRAIDMIHLKERFSPDAGINQVITNALADIQFNFSKIGTDELKIISGGIELQEKYKRTIQSFTENADQEDPEYITLRKLFAQRLREHNFVIDTVAKYTEESKALDDILTKLHNLKKQNDNLLQKYNGDVKFVRVHKRIREENKNRCASIPSRNAIISNSDIDILSVLLSMKHTIDRQVYDRNDILKQRCIF